MLGPFLFVIGPHGLKLFLLLTIFVNLFHKFILEFLDLRLQRLNLWLLEIELFALIDLVRIFAELTWSHLSNTLLQLCEFWLLQRDCLSTISLLLLEFDVLLSSHAWLLLLPAHHGSISHCSHILHHTSSKSLTHVHLFGHWWLSLELVMDSLDDCGQG